MTFGLGEDNFAFALHLRTVVPALKQREMALPSGCIGRVRGRFELLENSLHPFLEHRARNLHGSGVFWRLIPDPCWLLLRHWFKSHGLSEQRT